MAILKVTEDTAQTGDIVYFDGKGWVTLGIGPNGEYLKSQGAGNPPVWAAPGASSGKALTWTWGVGVTVGGTASPCAVATNPSNVYLPCSQAAIFQRVDMIAVTGPIGAALVVDILKSTDHGASFASIFTTKPQISDSTLGGGTGAVFAGGATINAGDVLRLDITQVGSINQGNNVVINLLAWTT